MSSPPVVDAIAQSNILSTVQELAQGLTAAVAAVDALAKSEPVKLLVRARSLQAVKTGLPWVVVPLVGAGLAYWGVRAWRRRSVEPHTAVQQSH